MKKGSRAGIAGVVAAMALGLFVWFSAREMRRGLGKGAVPAAVQGVTIVAQPPSQPTGDPPGLTIGKSPYEGKKDAPVIMIECSDFQCPFCARFAHDDLRQLRENDIRKGKVMLVFKNFPLPFHRYAEKAAEAAACAYKQGKFWQMHDRMFSASGMLDVNSLKSYAKEIGLNARKFDHCLDSGETAGMVQADKSACAAAGVTGTPTFFLNGRMLVGVQPYERFESAIVQAEK